MREPRIIRADDSALSTLYKDGWELKAIHEGKMYFDREIKKSRAQKKSERTPEYSAFYEKYPRKDGITTDAFVLKFQKAVESFGSYEMMESLGRYITYWKNSNLASGRPEKDTQYVPMASKWINDRRYETQPASVFVPETKKKQSEMESFTSHLPENVRKKVVAVATQYLEDHKDKTLTKELITAIAHKHGHA